MKKKISRRQRNKLVIEHLDWAHAIARQVSRFLPSWFTTNDLIGPADVALMLMAAQYDPTRGVPFRAFAQARIYGACVDSIRRREYLERAHGSIEGLEYLPCLRPSPEDQTAAREEAKQDQKIWALVQQLPSRHAMVILGVYGGGMTLEKLAGKVDVKPSRLSQIHREALGMLRAMA